MHAAWINLVIAIFFLLCCCVASYIISKKCPSKENCKYQTHTTMLLLWCMFLPPTPAEIALGMSKDDQSYRNLALSFRGAEKASAISLTDGTSRFQGHRSTSCFDEWTYRGPIEKGRGPVQSEPRPSRKAPSGPRQRTHDPQSDRGNQQGDWAEMVSFYHQQRLGSHHHCMIIFTLAGKPSLSSPPAGKPSLSSPLAGNSALSSSLAGKP